MTIETKIAKNGAVNFYANGKRVSRAKAIEIATANRQGAPFTVVYFAYNTKVGNVTENTITVGNLVISVASKAHRYDMFFEVMIDNVRVAFTGGYKTDATAVKNAKVNANVIANAIVAAYINGATGVKIVAGNVEILSAAEENDVEDELIDEPEITAKTTTVEAEITADNNVNVEKNGTQMVIVPIADYNTCLTWAEKISNGQLDTVTQIATHIKKWFDADINKAAVIDTIKADDLNGFRKFLAQFNFLVKDDAGYLHKLYSYNDECVLAEIPTSEYSNVETEAANVESELPTGEITVDSGAEAWSLVGKHFPKGNLEFYRAYKGFNNEDKFCYTLDEIIYVHVTCTPDNSRVELIEVINTYESGSKRKPLTVYIKPAPASDDAVTNNVVETCATVQIATDSAPVDDFSAKLAALDAEIAEAENARNAAKAAYNKADAEARNAIAARQEFLDNVAGNLTRKLQAACVNNDFIQTTTIHGRLYTIGDFGNVYIDPTANGDFAFVTYDNRTLARYDTPAQIEAVIARIKDTIDRKDVVFYFPTIDELNKPATADSLTRAMKIALDCYKGFCYVGNLTAAERELILYNICRKAMTKLRKE